MKDKKMTIIRFTENNTGPNTIHTIPISIATIKKKLTSKFMLDHESGLEKDPVSMAINKKIKDPNTDKARCLIFNFHKSLCFDLRKNQ